MATRVELPKAIVKRSIELSIQSVARAAKGATNPIIKDALEQELTALRAGEITLQETK